jgi:hypothetical protein
MPDLSVNEQLTKRATAATRLAALQRKAEALRQRIAEVEAQEKAKGRKKDTRFKVITGAAMLADAELRPETRAVLVAVLRRAVTAPRDREFGEGELKQRGWL